jgi:uncharacterized membrane protein
LRSIAKALSWRFMGTVGTFCVALFITRKLEIAFQIGLVDTVLKIGAFYGHERLWGMIKLGRKIPPDSYT